MNKRNKTILIVVSSIVLLTIVFLVVIDSGFLAFLIVVFSLLSILIGLGFKYGKKNFKIILSATIVMVILVIINMNMTNSFNNRISGFTGYPQYDVILIFPLLFLTMSLVVKYCKKKLKIILSSIIILTALYCVIFTIDIDRITNHRKPIFAWKTNNISGFPGVTPDVITYQGLGYKVIYDIEYFEDGRIESESTTMYNMFGKRIIDVSEVFVDVIHFNQLNIVEPPL